METFLGVLSAILGMINVIQWIVGFSSGNSLRGKAQSSYNQWFQVAELAEQIRKDPARAVELAAGIHAIANATRSEIVAYSRERLAFVPSFEPPWQPAAAIAKPHGLWSKIWLGFRAK